MIKILFFIPGLSEGGAEKVLRSLVNNMDQSKFDITVHTMSEEKNPDKYLKKGIRYKAINKCRTSLGRKLYQYWIRLCAELKILYPLYIKDDYDIEVAYLECGATKIISSSTNKEALKFAWVHCDLAKKEGFMDTIEKSREYYKKYDKIVCVSEDVRKSFEKNVCTSPEAIVLYNVNDEGDIISKSKAYKIPESDKKAKMLVAVGRLAYQKGFDRLINACGKLKDEGYTFKLNILGEGPERDNLQVIIDENNLDDCVELKGFIDNPYPYISAADMIVCSSRYEGFSTVVTEALILGKVIVTTPCTGMEELLGDSEYGFITEDSVEGIYTGIKSILDSKQLEEKYLLASVNRGKDFRKTKIIQETEKFFISELKEKRNEVI